MAEIEKAKSKDIKEIIKIFREEYSKYPYNEKWSEKDAEEKIKEYFKNNTILILKLENELIGFIIGHNYLWYDGQRGFIDEIVILKKHQSKGYGKMLIKEFENNMENKGVRNISLFSATKSVAFEIYKKLGYKEHNFVSMEKNLK